MVARLLTDGQELFEDIHTSIFSITALWQNCTTPLFGISLGYTPYVLGCIPNQRKLLTSGQELFAFQHFGQLKNHPA